MQEGVLKCFAYLFPRYSITWTSIRRLSACPVVDWLSETAYINTNVSSQTNNLSTLYGANLGFDNVVAEGIAVDNNGYFLLDNYGDAILYSNIETIIRQDTNSFQDVNHGDWVLEAFTSGLERPELTEIICIDVDTLNGTGNHFSELFYNNNLENIIYDYMLFNDIDNDLTTPENMYFLAISASISGSVDGGIEAVTFGENYQTPIFQAAPNVSQGYFDWGSAYPDVINVGAWNVSQNGDLLISSIETFDTIDIVADGYILNDDWNPDSNFGTSFATPRVTASYTNIVNEYIYQLNEANELGTSIEDSPAINYTSEISSLVDYMTTPVTFNSGGTYTVNLLNETIDETGSIQPISTTYICNVSINILIYMRK